jgi:hypothetical protein
MVDTSIAMGYRPIQIENPINQLAQMLQIQQAQKQGQLADLNMQTAQRGFEEQNKLRDYFASNDPKSENFARGLYAISPQKGMDYDKVVFDRRKDEAEIDSKKAATDKTRSDIVDSKLKLSRSLLDGVQTPEQYLAWHQGNHADPVLGPVLAARGVTVDTARAQINQALSQPGGFQQLLQRSALGLDKFTELNKPTYQTQNLGDRTNLLAMPGLGGALFTVSSEAINQSPDNNATNTTSRLNNTATNDTSRANNTATVGASVDNNLRTVGASVDNSIRADDRIRSEGGLNRDQALLIANKPTYQTQNTGNNTSILSFPGLGGAPVTVASAPINQSPDSAASIANSARTANMTDARTRSEGALNRGVTVAGQDKTDARARELNQITNDNKLLTEGQSKSALFGSRMMMANTIFDTLEKAGTTTSTPGMNSGYGVGNVISALSSADQQQLMQAKRDFLNAILRRESGAAIGESEFANGERQYFPQVGDTKQVITQKRANREAAMRGVLVDVPERRRAEIVREITGATPGSPGAPGAPGAANLLPSLPPADSSNRGKRARDTQTGKVYKSNGTAWVEE